MHNLEATLRQRISDGLKRQSITSCSKWSTSYRIMGKPFPGPWTFKYHPWAKDMCDCEADLQVGMKAAQMGYTEVGLNKTFYRIDIHQESVLYVLPALRPDAHDFSTGRFDPALEMSPHLANLFTDVANIGHKRSGSANLYIRGSNSRSQLKSIPVPMIVFDEVEEMNLDNIPLAFERTAGQPDKMVYMISTPRVEKIGIDAYYQNTTQDHFFFRCPHCNRLTELVYPDCLVITADDINDPKIRDSYLICKECKGTLEHADKFNWLSDGQWVSSYSGRLSIGWHISQLYSSTMHPGDIGIAVLKAESNASDEQELYNSKLGLCHTVEGARVTDAHIEQCISSYTKTQSNRSGMVTMGVDVGKWLHYEIVKWQTVGGGNDINLSSKGKLIAEGKVKEFEELDQLMINYRVIYAVVDANPETRKAKEFARRFWGHVRVCYYIEGIRTKEIRPSAEEEHTVSVDRTSWMDLSLGRFKSETLTLPRDLSLEYKMHIKAPVRIYEKDKSDNPVGRYVKGNEDDHHAHTRTYSEIALQLAGSLAESEDIGDVY